MSKADFENLSPAEQFTSLHDRLSDEADQCRNDGADDIAKLLDEAREEIESLRKDAERYRWLTEDHHRHETRQKVYDVALSLNIRGKGHIDAAIDAARSKT